MLGIIVGTVCVVGLVRMLGRRRGWRGRFGYGPGRHGYGRRRRWMLGSLFERLQTTPGQEKVIVSALEELRETRKSVRDELKQTRGDLARAVKGGLVDDASLEDTFSRHDRVLAVARVSFVEALKKITEVLDEEQRKKAADVLGGARLGGLHAWRDAPLDEFAI
jgi:hypothetical protein